MTRLGYEAERLIEVGWLSLAVALPAYFNPFASVPSEPAKTLLLLTTVLLMASGSLVWVVEEGRRWRERVPQLDRPGRALLWGSVAYLGAWVLSTFTSLSPRVSLWGWEGRPMGTITLAALLGLFVILGVFLRSQEQARRLISALLLGSLPVSLFGLIQGLGWDPTPYVGDQRVLSGWKVLSTFGNYIFVGAYLSMLIPLAVARLLETRERLRQLPAGGRPGAVESSLAPLLGRLVLLTCQLLLLAVFFIAGAERDHLWWGTLPMLAVFLQLFVLSPQVPLPNRLSLLLEGVGYVGLIALHLTVIGMSIARGPWLGLAAALVAFGVLWNIHEGTRRSVMVFAGAVGVAAVTIMLLNLPSSPLDSLKKSSPILGRVGSLWETKEGSGGVRLAIWRSGLSVIVHRPVIDGDPLSPLRPLVGFGPDMAVVALEQALPVMYRGERDAELVAERLHNVLLDHLVERGMLGLLAYGGFLIVAVWVCLHRLWQARAREDRLLVVGVLSAVVAHVVEGQTGLPIVGTETMFWIFLALPMQGRRPDESSIPLRAVVERKSKVGRKREARESPRLTWRVVLAVVYVLATGAGLLFLAASDPPRWVLGWTVGSYAWWLLGLVLAALALGKSATLPWRRGSLWLYAVILGVVVYGLVRLLTPSAADLLYKVGYYEMMERRNPLAAFPAFQQAAALSPRSDLYYSAMGGALVARAVQRPAARESMVIGPPNVASLLTLSPIEMQRVGREGLLAFAGVALEEARRLAPFNFRRHVELGRFYRLRAANGATEQLDRAAEAYRHALNLAPFRGWIYPELAIILVTQGRPAEAVTVAHRGLEIEEGLWTASFVLALAYRDLGKRKEAAAQAHRAMTLAPPEQREGARRLLASLEGQTP